MSGTNYEGDDNAGYPTTVEDLGLDRVPTAPATTGDKLIKGDGRMNPKHMAIAHMAAGGANQKTIAEAMDMTPSRISIILSQSELKEEIKRIQKETFGDSIEKRFRASVHKAMDVMEGVIDDEGAKDRDRMQASQWVLEKVTGKATQHVEHGGNVLAGLMDQLDSMKAAEEAIPVGEQILELEEKSGADQQLDAFVAGNVPDRVRVGDKGEE